VQETIFG
jgi:hypothetical protein